MGIAKLRSCRERHHVYAHGQSGQERSAPDGLQDLVRSKPTRLFSEVHNHESGKEREKSHGHESRMIWPVYRDSLVVLIRCNPQLRCGMCAKTGLQVIEMKRSMTRLITSTLRIYDIVCTIRQDIGIGRYYPYSLFNVSFESLIIIDTKHVWTEF